MLSPIPPVQQITDTVIQRALSDEYKDAGMNVYVTSDSSNVIEDKFRAVAYSQSERMRPTLILLGTRLGIDRVTPVYRKSLEALLKLPQSLGIAGYVCEYEFNMRYYIANI